ncbi:hypothetical protein [Novosphingobium sp. FKTRR1]|uniref:hypothetical protein n=1 Tax=Novosphingobium sp. FKTRR1 TaxID=2879118 RepID=UPI001CEFF676|nr:hypothetical protein [Novosphingobium sp. FKTRR1]
MTIHDKHITSCPSARSDADAASFKAAPDQPEVAEPEVAEIADEIAHLLGRLDAMGLTTPGNHISHGLELLRLHIAA